MERELKQAASALEVQMLVRFQSMPRAQAARFESEAQKRFDDPVLDDLDDMFAMFGCLPIAFATGADDCDDDEFHFNEETTFAELKDHLEKNVSLLDAVDKPSSMANFKKVLSIERGYFELMIM